MKDDYFFSQNRNAFTKVESLIHAGKAAVHADQRERNSALAFFKYGTLKKFNVASGTIGTSHHCSNRYFAWKQ